MISVIRFRKNLYDSNNNTDDELILRDNLIRYRAAVKFFKIGPHIERVNLPTSKVAVEAKKKLLERKEGEKYLVTPKMPRAGQWILT